MGKKLSPLYAETRILLGLWALDTTPVKVIKCTTVDLRAFQRSVFKNQKFIPAVCFSF